MNYLFFGIWPFQTLCKMHFVPALEFHYCSLFFLFLVPVYTVRVFQGRSNIPPAVGPDPFLTCPRSRIQAEAGASVFSLLHKKK